MKKIISLLLVLLLALTSAFAVNAEGIKDIFGVEKAPRGDVTYSVCYVDATRGEPLVYGTVTELAEDSVYSLPEQLPLYFGTHCDDPQSSYYTSPTIDEYYRTPITYCATGNDKVFAGWFKTAYASRTNNLDLSLAWEKSIAMDSTNDLLDGYEDHVITLYAGWVTPGDVNQDPSDPNLGYYGRMQDLEWDQETGDPLPTTTVCGFGTQGVQIKSTEIPEIGHDAAIWQGARYNGMRFLAVYSNSFINRLNGLYASGTAGYSSANDSDVSYGFTMYAITDYENLPFGSGFNQILYLNSAVDVEGVIDVDCTRTGDWNHKMFNAYRLSTVVIRYSDDEQTAYAQMDTQVEARAYIDYIDANGYARRQYEMYDQWGSNDYAGGCRTSFYETEEVLIRPSNYAQ